MEFIRKNSLLISLFISIASFIAVRLPFFLFMPLVSFEIDIYDYWYFVEIINSGQLPKFDVIPGGFPVFLYLIGLISNKAITVAIIQNLITLFSSLFLIVAINRFYEEIGVFATIGIMIFVNGNFNIQFDNSYNPESIYVNSIIIVVGLLIFAINTNKKAWWILLSLSLIIPAIIRSNGIFIYYIIPFTLIYYMVNKRKFNFYLWLLIPITITNLLWASYNYYTAGIFMISNPTRIINIFSDNPKWAIQLISNNQEPRGSIGKSDRSINSAIECFSLFKAQKSPYYYTYLSQRYHEMYVSNLVYNGYAAFDGTMEVPELWKKNAMKEYYHTHPLEKNKKYFSFYSETEDSIISTMSYSEIRAKIDNEWIFLTFLIHLFYEWFIYKSIWLVLFIVCFIISFAVLLRMKFKNKFAFLAFIIISVHIVSLIIITITHGYSPGQSFRYEYTTEFSVYLAPVFTFHLLKSTGIINEILSKLKLIKRLPM